MEFSTLPSPLVQQSVTDWMNHHNEAVIDRCARGARKLLAHDIQQNAREKTERRRLLRGALLQNSFPVCFSRTKWATTEGLLDHRPGLCGNWTWALSPRTTKAERGSRADGPGGFSDALNNLLKCRLHRVQSKTKSQTLGRQVITPGVASDEELDPWSDCSEAPQTSQRQCSEFGPGLKFQAGACAKMSITLASQRVDRGL